MSSTGQEKDNFTLKLSNPVAIGLLLALVIVCLFPTLQNDWVNWDDPAYVLNNSLVKDLSSAGIYNMFSAPEQVGLYHPFTLVSLAIDYHFWGENAFGFHLTNIIIHLLNVALVFALLKHLKASQLVAFLGALLFGMHPMHVESVAWISARKDVLYTLFFLISLIVYLRYLNREAKMKYFLYFLALFSFTLSLLSKSLSFTLPLILFLIDYLMKRKFDLRLVLEKIPFVILAIFALYMAKQGQESSDSIVEGVGFDKSVFMASYNVVGYGIKSIVPVHLSAFHPMQIASGFDLSALFYISIVPVLALIYFLYRWSKSSPILFFGITFYLISLAPVSQLIPFGKAISSERYTYVPYIGLVFLIAVGIEKILTKYSKSRVAILALFGSWFLFLGVQTNLQSRVWKNSEVLWSSVIERYPDSEWAYMSRGLERLKQDDLQGAISDLDVSLSIYPFPQALYERGYLYEKEGNFEKAVDLYEQCIAAEESYAKAHLNLGVIHAKNRELEPAFESFKSAIKYDDSYSLAHFNLGIFYKIKGDFEASIESYSKAIELESENGLYVRHRGVLFNQLGRFQKAINDFDRAIELEPNSGEPYFLRSQSYLGLKQMEKARADVNRAQEMGLQINPEYLKRLE